MSALVGLCTQVSRGFPFTSCNATSSLKCIQQEPSDGLPPLSLASPHCLFYLLPPEGPSRFYPAIACLRSQHPYPAEGCCDLQKMRQWRFSRCGVLWLCKHPSCLAP